MPSGSELREETPRRNSRGGGGVKGEGGEGGGGLAQCHFCIWL